MIHTISKVKTSLYFQYLVFSFVAGAIAMFTSPACADVSDREVERYREMMFHLKHGIESKWKPPADSRNRHALVSVIVALDGSAVDVKLVESSGSPNADSAAMEAVRKASPFSFGAEKPNEPFRVEFWFQYYSHPEVIAVNRRLFDSSAQYYLDSRSNYGQERLKRLEDEYLAYAFEYAERCEQFGDLDAASSVYDRIAFLVQSRFESRPSACDRVELARERIAFFKRAGEKVNAYEFKQGLFKLIQKLDRTKTLSGIAKNGLYQQMVDAALRCNLSPLDLSNDWSSIDLSPRSRYAIAKLTRDAALHRGDSIATRKLDENVEKCLESIISVARAKALEEAAFQYEINSEYDQALRLYSESLRILQSQLGEDSPKTLLEKAYIGRVLSSQGKLYEAQQLFDAAIVAFKKRGIADPRFFALLEMYGDILHRFGKEPKSTEVYSEALEIWKKNSKCTILPFDD